MRTLYVFLFACTTFAPVAARDATHSAIESKIIAMEQAWNEAYKLRDTKALDSLLVDGMVIVKDDGALQSKPLFMEWIRKSKSTTHEQVTPESMTVQVYGPVVVATGVFRTSGIEVGKPYSRRDRFADTWLNKEGSWVCVSATATPVLH